MQPERPTDLAEHRQWLGSLAPIPGAGVWADIGDESVFIAAKIRKDNNYAFKVRLTSDGQPFWTMSADKLAMEKASIE